MSLVINDSSNVAVLSARIIANLCTGYICVDLTPTTWIGSGKDNVLGANFQITNPFGVVIKSYGTSYDIAPDLSGGMDAPVCVALPTTAGTYQFGRYTVESKLTDENGTTYVETKYVTVCAPNPKNKQKNFGDLSAQLLGDCKNGRLSIIIDTPPNYNGQVFESQEIDTTLEYPTSSGLPVLTSEMSSWSVQLFEGVYKLNGQICATYNFGDSVFVIVKYKVKREKNIRCLIDECCVLTALAGLSEQLNSNCSNQTKEEISNKIFDALRLLKMIEISAQCGEDPSDFIVELETLLGCSCTCNCADGAPIINTQPTGDFVIEGCGVEKNITGLTTTYTINNYTYVVAITDNGGALTISGPVTDDCTVTRTITFNINAVYSQIKTLANQNNTEADVWSSIVNKGLRDVDPTCLGITSSTWQAMTWKQKFDKILAQFCTCCGCDGTISNVDVTQAGADVNVDFDVSTNVLFADLYMDGVFKGRVFTPAIKTDLTFTFVGAADGNAHTYNIIPLCANNSIGTYFTGEFLYAGCPDIEPPTVSTNVVSAECPFDLTSILTPPPVGITVEWHTANNTLISSLIGNPTSVNSGTYYAFSKDADGCFSISTQVTVICEAGSSCSAPQNLTADVPLQHGPVRILFQSAAFPPPANSYTVKRRLFTDPDIDGSYTTIGTPVWNSSLNRWQILDSSYTENTLYVYKAISNCGDSPTTAPSASVTFAGIVCPAVTPTPDTDSVDYSFETTGSNEITEYRIGIYDATGTILIHQDTYTPAFANPITGTFTYLTPGTTYKIKVTACIGSYCSTCSTVTTVTTDEETENFSLHAANGMNITGVSGTGVPSMPVVNSPGSANGHQTGITGAIPVDLTGTPGASPCKLTLYVNGVANACVAVASAGTYGLTPSPATVESDDVIISVEIGTC